MNVPVDIECRQYVDLLQDAINYYRIVPDWGAFLGNLFEVLDGLTKCIGAN